jgi:hypothetical protein
MVISDRTQLPGTPSTNVPAAFQDYTDYNFKKRRKERAEQQSSGTIASPHSDEESPDGVGVVLGVLGAWELGTREQTQQANHYQLVAPVRNFTNPVPDTRSMITSITSHREHNKMRSTVTIGSEQYHSSLLLRNGRTKRKQKRNERKKIRFSFLHMILNSS